MFARVVDVLFAAGTSGTVFPSQSKKARAVVPHLRLGPTLFVSIAERASIRLEANENCECPA